MGRLKTIKEKEMKYNNRFISVKRIKDTKKDEDFIFVTEGIAYLHSRYPKNTVIVPIGRADELADIIKRMAKTSEKVYDVEIPISLDDNYVTITIETEETDKHKIMEEAIEKAKALNDKRIWDVNREVLHDNKLSHFIRKQKKPKSIREILDGI